MSVAGHARACGGGEGGREEGEREGGRKAYGLHVTYNCQTCRPLPDPLEESCGEAGWALPRPGPLWGWAARAHPEPRAALGVGGAGSTCYRGRCPAATRDCWGCGWHPGHRRRQGPTVGRHLSTPVVSTGTGSAPGPAHPSGRQSGWAWTRVCAHPPVCTPSRTELWSAPARLTCPTVRFPPTFA